MDGSYLVWNLSKEDSEDMRLSSSTQWKERQSRGIIYLSLSHSHGFVLVFYVEMNESSDEGIVTLALEFSGVEAPSYGSCVNGRW